MISVDFETIFTSSDIFGFQECSYQYIIKLLNMSKIFIVSK